MGTSGITDFPLGKAKHIRKELGGNGTRDQGTRRQGTGHYGQGMGHGALGTRY